MAGTVKDDVVWVTMNGRRFPIKKKELAGAKAMAEHVNKYKRNVDFKVEGKKRNVAEDAKSIKEHKNKDLKDLEKRFAKMPFKKKSDGTYERDLSSWTKKDHYEFRQKGDKLVMEKMKGVTSKVAESKEVAFTKKDLQKFAKSKGLKVKYPTYYKNILFLTDK